ncbi:TraC family protein [Burkholderia glumae]|uniref:TraC family protein n=1 Tax=Burkholderia glumae TaxID=337 RepID=UPI0020CE3443|nr:TraC family protein [Burkholderia glumae]MCQ0033960.1 TraC family protein [Burkholderia glumae]MCQ0037362.1 TraC family protein [Burkholderia glumae]
MGSIQEWVDSARSLATTMAKELVFGTDDDLGPPAPTVADQRRVDNVGLHQLLPYDQYDPATELYYNTSSIGFVLVVAPQTGANDELARTLLGLYDTMPADHGVQWMMLADPIIEEHLDRYVDLRRTYANSGEAPPSTSSRPSAVLPPCGRTRDARSSTARTIRSRTSD